MTEPERWKALETWIKGYILFNQIDRQSGNKVLMMMEELEAGSV